MLSKNNLHLQTFIMTLSYILVILVNVCVLFVSVCILFVFVCVYCLVSLCYCAGVCLLLFLYSDKEERL